MSRKIIAILLIPVLLFSTTSFSLNKHLCGEDNFSVAIIVKAQDCGMTMNNCKYNNLDNFNFSKKSCCLDDSQFIQGSLLEQNKEVDLDKLQINFLFAFIHSYDLLFKELKPSIEFSNYKPPLITKEISVLYEVYRI